jgi:fatty acid desaturase
MLDSVTLDSDSLAARLINPVGLRYHATHHLFPSLPYHNMRLAHKRLLEKLPAYSPYRQTAAHSLWQVIADLWRRASMSQTGDTVQVDHASVLPATVEQTLRGVPQA